MLSLKAVSQFKKDIKKYQHKKAVIDELDEVIHLLRARKKRLKNTEIIPLPEIMLGCVNVTLSPMPY